MSDQRATPRADDADARGDHDYGQGRTKRPDDPSNDAPLRLPHSYAAGEHGTQQVTTPAGSGASEKADEKSERE
jgi:hypothetical protein